MLRYVEMELFDEKKQMQDWVIYIYEMFAQCDVPPALIVVNDMS